MYGPVNRRRPELELALRLKALPGTLILAALIATGCGDDETSNQEIEAAVERFYTATGDRDVAGICDSMIVLAPGEFGSLTSDDFANKLEEQDRWCESDLNQGLRGFADNFPAGGGSVDVVDPATTVNGATAHTRVEGERNGKPDSGALKLAKPSDGDWRVVLTFRGD